MRDVYIAVVYCRLLAPRDVSCLSDPLISSMTILVSPFPISLLPVSFHAKIDRIVPLCLHLCNVKTIFLMKNFFICVARRASILRREVRMRRTLIYVTRRVLSPQWRRELLHLCCKMSADIATWSENEKNPDLCYKTSVELTVKTWTSSSVLQDERRYCDDEVQMRLSPQWTHERLQRRLSPQWEHARLDKCSWTHNW